jgi:hypothetical protein
VAPLCEPLTISHLGIAMQVSLPPNAVCSAPPDGALDFRGGLAAATTAFARLFPEAAAANGGQLFGSASQAAGSGEADPAAGRGGDGGSGADEDSDDDTLAALQAALSGISVNGEDGVNGIPGIGSG